MSLIDIELFLKQLNLRTSGVWAESPHGLLYCANRHSAMIIEYEILFQSLHRVLRTGEISTSWCTVIM